MHTLKLILGFRFTHVPGEPEAVLARAWERIYRPIVEQIREHDELNVFLHLSGALLDFTESRYREDLLRIRELVSEGRVGLLGGGYYDPVLSALPERDAVGQLRLMNGRLERLFGYRARGVWLAYGAWDPVLPRLLGRQGLQYALLPGATFRIASQLEPPYPGYYATDREGVSVAVFAGDPLLARIRPRLDPGRVIALLRKRAAEEEGPLTWCIDARELGLRAGSWESAWGREGSWTPRLFRLLAGQDHWLKTTSFEEALQRDLPQRTIHLASACPPPLVDHAFSAEEKPLSVNAGVPWERFLSRYDEANRLHKRMLRASSDLALLARKRRNARTRGERAAIQSTLERGLRALYRGQSGAPLCNDEWGGIYAGRLRHDAYASVIRAEFMARRMLSERLRFRFDRQDVDSDGKEEVLVTTPNFGAVVDPDAGGALVQVDSWALPGNLLNVLARRQERYLVGLGGSRNLPALVEGPLEAVGPAHLPPEPDAAEPAPLPPEPGAAEPAAPPPVEDDETQELRFDEQGLVAEVASEDEDPGVPPGDPAEDLVSEDRLAVDARGRPAFIERFPGPQATPRNFRRGMYPENGDFAGLPYRLLRTEIRGTEIEVRLDRTAMVQTARRPHSVRIVKEYRFSGEQAGFVVRYELSNRYREPVDTRFGVELNLNLDSNRSGQARLRFRRGEDHPVHLPGEHEGVANLSWMDPGAGYRLDLAVSPAANLWHHPVEAIARSASGLEVTFQGTCLLLWWPLSLWGEERRQFRIEARLRVGRASPASDQRSRSRER